jgi:hypothetical protein
LKSAWEDVSKIPIFEQTSKVEAIADQDRSDDGGEEQEQEGLENGDLSVGGCP